MEDEPTPTQTQTQTQTEGQNGSSPRRRRLVHSGHRLDSLLQSRFAFYGEILSAVLCATASSATAAPTAGGLGLDTVGVGAAEALKQLLARRGTTTSETIVSLQTQLANRDLEVERLRASLAETTAESRGYLRTLERLKYDHPDTLAQCLHEHSKGPCAHKHAVGFGAGDAASAAAAGVGAGAQGAGDGGAVKTRFSSVFLGPQNTADAVAAAAAAAPRLDATGGYTAIGDRIADAPADISGSGSGSDERPIMQVDAAPSGSRTDTPLASPSANTQAGMLVPATGLSIASPTATATAADTTVASAAAAAAGAAELEHCKDQLAALTDQLTTLREELAAEKARAALAEERLAEARIRPASVFTSVEYLQAISAAAESEEKAAQAHATLDVSRREIASLHASLRQMEEQALALRTQGSVRSDTRAAFDAHIASLREAVTTAIAERDSAVRDLIEARAAAEAASAFRLAAEESAALASRLQKEQAALRVDWSNRTLAASNTAAGAANDVDAATLAAEKASLEAEKVELVAMIESLSVSFEETSAQTAAAVEALRVSGDTVQKLQASLLKAAEERRAFMAVGALKDKQLEGAAEALAAAKKSVEAERAVAAAERDRRARDLEALASARRESDRLRDSLQRGMQDRKGLASAAAFAAQEAAMRMAALKAEVAEAEAQGESQARASTAAAIALNEAQRKLARRDEKIAKLKDRLAGVPGASVSHGLSRSQSMFLDASSAATPLPSVGGGGGGSGNAVPAKLSELERLYMGQLQRMVKCPVCQIRNKDCVITKCFHMFCSDCVAENIRTRSRKCPSCHHPFGEPDVKKVFLE
jgi:hypothetical protein